MKKSILLILFILISVQSRAQQQAKELSQMQRVMKVHDAIMEKDMGATVKLIGQLETMAKAAASSAEYESAITDLKDANKTMVDWMQGFGQRFTYNEMYKGKTLTSQKKEHLKEEEVKLMTMKKQIDASIKKAQLLLNYN
jgi:hypothetical protein